MIDTDGESASTAVYVPTLLDELDAMSATQDCSSSGERALPRWLTARGWCEAMGISSAAQEAIGVQE